MGGATLLLLWQMGDDDGAVEADTVVNYYTLRGIANYRATLAGIVNYRADLRGIEGYRREIKEAP